MTDVKASPPRAETAARGKAGYEDDLYTWVEEQVALLRAHRFDELDVENVAEELLDVGRAQYDKLESSLKVLLMHMLKWDQQPEHRSYGWVGSIAEQRKRIERLLKKNPGLKPRLEEALTEGYQDGLLWAALETSLPRHEFPENCPYTWDEILHRPFEMDEDRRR